MTEAMRCKMKKLLLTLTFFCFLQTICLAYTQTKNVKVGETFTVDGGTYRYIQAVLWKFDTGVFETVSVSQYSTRATFKAVNPSPSAGAVIQATIYYHKNGTTSTGVNKDVVSWKIYVADDGSKSTVSLPNSMTMDEGQIKEVTATLSNSKYSGNFKWTTSNSNIVDIIGRYGNVATLKANSQGSTYINVTLDNGNSDRMYVTVNSTKILVSRISIDRTSATLKEGNTLQLLATVYPSDATDKTITWTSSNNSIASVSSSGYVTAKKAGTATITCTANDGSGVSAKCNVIVEEKEDPSIHLNTHSLTCQQDEWAGELYPVSYNGPSLNWNYNENFVLCQKHPTIKNGVKIKGLAIGETNITVSNSKGGKDICRLTVSPKDRYEVGDTIKIADDKIAIHYPVLSNSPKTCAIDNIGQSEISATFTIPEKVAGYTVAEVGKEAFHYNAFLKQVIIPETVRYIGEDAFSYCFNIEQISFPSSLEMIGLAAFTHTNLKKVIFSNGLKTIGKFAFAFSTIEDVVLVDGLEEIKECAFYCTPCKNLTLPNTLKSIETEAFNAYNDHSYNKITSRIENPFPIADNVFNDLTYQNATLIVPASSKHKYEQTPGWKNFKNIETYGEANTDVVIYEGLNEDNTICDWTFETYDVDDSFNYTLSENQVWKWDQYNGKYYLMANAHEFPAPFYVNAFAYSPAINVKGLREFTISFEHAAKYQESGMFSHYLVRLYEVNPEGKVGELLSIAPEIPVLPKAGSWAYVNSGDITLKLDELQANVNSIFIVLFYHGDSDNGANRWQVKNLKMTSSKAAAVQDIIVDDSVSCYPTEVYNLSGIKVADSTDNLPAGIYIVRRGPSVRKIAVRKP